jgi:hypothetical protein
MGAADGGRHASGFVGVAWANEQEQDGERSLRGHVAWGYVGVRIGQGRGNARPMPARIDFPQPIREAEPPVTSLRRPA